MAPPDRPSTTPRPAGAGSDKSLPTLGKELVDLTVTYAKQETIDPLRTMGKRVGMGVAGAAVASVGLIFLLVGVLRLVQVEARPHLRGGMSWVPYLAAVAVAAPVALFALKQIGGGREK